MKAILSFPSLAGLALLLSAQAAFGRDDYSQWSYFKDLTLNTGVTGADVATDQIGFPALVSLAAAQADVFAHAATAGADIRFAKADGTHLPYQIDNWNAATQQAAIWVKVDTVKGGNAAQHIRMYWGNAAAADSSDGKAVFPVENGFKGVWHLGASLDDATANKNNGTDSGTAVAQDGRIGPARFFDNPGAYVTDGKFISLGSPANLNFGGKITMEAWVRWNRRDNHRIVICHGGALGVDFETVLRIGETLDYRAGVWTGVGRYATLIVPPADSNTWIQLTGVFTGSEWDLYRNGLKVSSTAPDTNGAKMTPAGWRIGAEWVSNTVTRYFSGWLDEIRLSNSARSADWIKLNYANQKSDQTLVSFGATTTTAIASPPVPWPDPGENISRPLDKIDILGRTRWFLRRDP